jgi:predicted double-glycine peptidase
VFPRLAVLTTIAVALGPAARDIAAHAPQPSGATTVRTLDVPYLPQTEDLCGGAAAVMVMRYWGARRIQPQDFASLVRSNGRGITTGDLTREVESRGWRGFPQRGSLASLEHHLRRGRPVIVLIEVRPRRHHYVVVVGSSADEILYHDPADLPFRRATTAHFAQSWAAGDRWMLVILPAVATTIMATPKDARAPTAGAASPKPGGVLPAPCRDSLARGVAQARREQLADATATLYEARLECPSSAAPIGELASVKLLEHQYDEAARLAAEATTRPDADDQTWRILGTAEFLRHRPLRALAAWNRAGEPVMDLARVEGLDRTRYTVVARALSLVPGAVLSAGELVRAQRRVADLPALSASQVEYAPSGNGLADVRAAVVERPALPTALTAWIALGVQAMSQRDVQWTIVSPTRNGETITASWRWWDERPRVRVRGRVPLYHSGVGAVMGLEGLFEQQKYATSTGIVQERRRAAGVSLGDWTRGGVRWTAGMGLDRWDDRGAFARIGGALETRALADRVALKAAGGLWRHHGGFGAANGGTRVRSSADDTSAAVLVSFDVAAASDSAPRDLWPGADTGQARAYLLRAHTLLVNGVVDGEAFGKRLVHGTTELRVPFGSGGAVRLAGSAFIDTARAWKGPRSHRVLIDAGIGLRVLLGREGTLRVDVAHGLSDGARALSVGWEPPWPHWSE